MVDIKSKNRNNLTKTKAQPKAEERAITFRATREQHRIETAEDYTELIAELIESTGRARTCDIADALGISHVTALRTIRRLQEQGYLNTSNQKPVVLTAKGKKTAAFSKERHNILLDFFIKIGVPEKIAEQDTEGTEHHISDTTLQCLKKLIKNL
jgi:DtxR family manganese transport transcriptional regulator